MKIKHTEKQGCKVELVLVKHIGGSSVKAKGSIIVDGEICRPIFIAKTEPITLEDWYLDDTNSIRQSVIEDENYWLVRKDYYKIIVLPENLSTQQLQDITDGKLKEGVGYYLECGLIFKCKYNQDRRCTPDHCDCENWYELKLTNNHVNILPPPVSVESAARAYVKTLPAINYKSAYDFGTQNIKAFQAGAKWQAEQNN